MKEKEVQNARSYTFSLRGVLFMPLMILLGIIPLIVRLVKTDIPDERVLYLTNNNIDLFSQAKSTFIFVMIGVMLIMIFLSYNKAYIKKGTTSYLYYISGAIFVVMTMVADALSAYPHIARWGIPTRAEGSMMLVCYIVMMLYTYSVVQDYKDYRYLLVPLGFLVLVLGVLGYYQYIGEDLLMTDWGKELIIPDYYAEDRALLKPLYKDKNIYGTLFHYNYVGSFAAMMVPLFGLLTCFIRNYKWKLFCGVSGLISLFLLFGSTARSGLIGVAVSFGVALILFGRYFVKHWKATLMGLGALAIVAIGLNTATQGAIFSRVPQLLKDMVQLVTPVEDFDYKANLPIKNIAHTKDQVVLELQDHELHVGVKDERLIFTDEKGEEVIFIFMDWGNENTHYFTQDERFENYKFMIEEQKGKKYARLIYKDLYVATFSIDEKVHFVDHFTKQPVDFVEPPTFGFKGKEKLGSARGYIWSRSLPLLKETWLIGTGPDTFGFYFPQNDILGKWYAYNTPSMIVDKPHNLYLQIAIQQGGIALLAFLALIGTYLIQSLKLYGFKSSYDEQQIVGMAFMLAVVGYLGAGIFNDSVVSVAPLFWILLGGGMAINYTLKVES